MCPASTGHLLFWVVVSVRVSAKPFLQSVWLATVFLTVLLFIVVSVWTLLSAETLFEVMMGKFVILVIR